jgi:hypothetical protein
MKKTIKEAVEAGQLKEINNKWYIVDGERKAPITLRQKQKLYETNIKKG